MKNPLHSLLIKPEELRTKANEIRRSGTRRGEYSGFESLDKIFTAKKGFPLFIAGAPHSGKSQVVKQLAINWATELGWKGILYMGEEGSAVDLLLDLVEVKTGKSARLNDADADESKTPISSDEFEYTIHWLDQHFTIIDPEKAVDVASWTYDTFNELLKEAGDFDFSVLDPFNDLDRDMELRDDLWLTKVLKDVRIAARRSNRVDVIVNHIAKTQHDGKTSNGMPVSKPARPNEWAGGQTWYRRAFTMLLVYRPPEHELIDFCPFDEAGEGYHVGPGEMWIQNQKAKPKGSGKLGWARLYYDTSRNQVFELDETGPNGRWTLGPEQKVNRYYSGQLKAHRASQGGQGNTLTTQDAQDNPNKLLF